LGHSFSKAYFDGKFAAGGFDDCRFENFPLEDISELAAVMEEHPDLCGFSVTIPYKREIIPWLDEISHEAGKIGAVNCVRVERDKAGGPGGPDMREAEMLKAGGQETQKVSEVRKVPGVRLSGHNTDAHGFRVGLEKLIGGERPRALVLGTGGASRAVRHVLESVGIEYRMVSRSPGAGSEGSPATMIYEELTPEIIAEHKLIVNTTPLGTFPLTEGRPAIPYDGIGPGHRLYDLVYNPAVTAFMAEGERRGARTLNGETMLHAQAEEAWKIWNQ
jgi:shikimate dehydrogenase